MFGIVEAKTWWWFVFTYLYIVPDEEIACEGTFVFVIKRDEDFKIVPVDVSSLTLSSLFENAI